MITDIDGRPPQPQKESTKIATAEVTLDSPLDVRMRAFEVVCRLVIKSRVGATIGSIKKGSGLGKLGAIDPFGLTPNQANVCAGRATNWLWEINQAVIRRESGLANRLNAANLKAA